MPATDVHQHLWPEPFVAALARRAASCPASAAGRSSSRGSRPRRCRPAPATRPRARRACAPTASSGRSLALSSPLGIEALGPGEARPLLDAWHDAVLGLGPAFGAWGALALGDAGPAEVDDLLDRGAVGLSLPPARSRRPSASSPGGRCSRRSSGVARRCSSTPDPGRGPRGAAPARDAAAWWPALTGYVASLQAAWLAWAGWGRAAHPRLRVVFAALAGLAPLQAERLAARGGPAGAVHDPLVFYDTSSYGHRAVDAMVRVVGIDALVHGTDRPVVAAPPHHGLGAGGRPRAEGRERRPPAATGRGGVIPPRPTRDLAPAEVEAWVRALAADPARWRHLVRHDPGERVYEELLRDDHLAVWLICWMEDHDTGFHDHDLSAGAVAVVDGAVREDRLLVGGPPASRVVAAGSSFSFAASDIHRVLHHGDAPGRDPPRLLAAAVADGRLRGRARRRPARGTRSPTPRSCARSPTRRRRGPAAGAGGGPSAAS